MQISGAISIPSHSIYDIAGRLATRVWARGITTSYGYTAGQLTSIDYSDATPDVTATYNRLGQLLTANQSGAATSPDADYTFGYNANTLRFATETVTIDPDGTGSLPSLTRTLDRSRDNLQRPTGFVLGNEQAVGYGYDVSGRLTTISAQGLPNLPGKSHAFEYTYEPGSNLLDKVTGPVHEVDNDYESHRNVLLQKKNTRTVGTPGELSVIGYAVNELGQRVQRNLRGEIRAEFYGGQAADQYPTNWGYDALGQVTSEDKPSTNADRSYNYDLIGNRLTSTADSVTTSYASNDLNQYTSIRPLPVGEGGGEGSSVQPAYDQDGNMTTGLLNGSTTGQFEYDGANQLIRTQATATSDPTRYAYDSFGRRIAKVTYPNAGGQATAATVFIYDGWNLIAEYKLNSGVWDLDRTYTWGKDLSGSMQGAGGVGGLLSVTKHETQSTTRFFPIYDGNGNIEAYVDSNGVNAAIYQYDAFGNVLSGGGKGASIEQAKFAHRFSTKYQDEETGLLYFGYRYLETRIGRWLNPDPIEEAGGLNLFGFVGNQSSARVDGDGLDYVPSGGATTVFNPGLVNRPFPVTGIPNTLDGPPGLKPFRPKLPGVGLGLGVFLSLTTEINSGEGELVAYYKEGWNLAEVSDDLSEPDPDTEPELFTTVDGIEDKGEYCCEYRRVGMRNRIGSASAAFAMWLQGGEIGETRVTVRQGKNVLASATYDATKPAPSAGPPLRVYEAKFGYRWLGDPSLRQPSWWLNSYKGRPPRSQEVAAQFANQAFVAKLCGLQYEIAIAPEISLPGWQKTFPNLSPFMVGYW